jgi:galactosylceramidase
MKTKTPARIKRLQKLAAAGMSVAVMPILAIGLGLGATLRAGECDISISGSDAGRAFEGIGAVSAGGNTCLLKDYPEPARSDVLDFLFKPKFGLGFQHLKVEIGGGENSTCGSEPSHAIVKEEKDHPKPRGYEFWFMSEARKRNPKILLDCLPWTYPAWCGGASTQDTADWYVSFLDCAKKTYGLELDYVGAAQNERDMDPNWVVNVLRPTLDKAGYAKLKLQGPDTTDISRFWKIFDQADSDPMFRKALDLLTAVSYHVYNIPPAPEKAKTSGKPLWMSEATIWETGTRAEMGLADVREILKFYGRDRMTKYEIWCPVASCYEGHTEFATFGFVEANQPWSGHYAVNDSLWYLAHVAQFADLGWKFLDPGCKPFDDKWQGSCISLKDPASDNWSIIAATTAATTLNVHLGPGLSRGTVHVWKSTGSDTFRKLADVLPADGALVLPLEANSAYSITTTTGQQKGQPPHPIATPARFPMPYAENFASYAIGDAPKYFMDQKGTFEVADDGRGGKCLKQILPAVGTEWTGRLQPNTLFGDNRWDSYELSAEVKIAGGDVALGGWNDSADSQGSFVGNNLAYCYTLDKSGKWTISYHAKPIRTGTVAGFDGNAWHTMKLRFYRTSVMAFLDGTEVGSLAEAEGSLQGRCSLSSTYHPNLFANLSVKPLNARVPAAGMKASATSNAPGYEPGNAIDGDERTFWHSSWEPVAPLPQSITLDLGGTFEVDMITYLPRQNGPNGIITEYNVYTSQDGVQFQKAATGKWENNKAVKLTKFTAAKARFIKLEALAGTVGCASAAEIGVYRAGDSDNDHKN